MSYCFIIRQSDTHHLRLTPGSVYFTPSLKTVAVLPFRKNQLLMHKPRYSVEHYTSHYQPMFIEHFILTWAPRHSHVTGVETKLWWLKYPACAASLPRGSAGWQHVHDSLPATSTLLLACEFVSRTFALHGTHLVQSILPRFCSFSVCVSGVFMFCWNRF